MPFIRQTNFSGGELSPYLHGRTDLPRFQTGLRACRNFFISRHGAAVSRPGTTYVAVKKQAGSDGIRLVPFIYSDEQSYVLEFGHQYVRFYTGGAQVQHSDRLLDYKDEVQVPAVSELLTGATSGAQGTVVSVSDAGSTGTLRLSGVSGSFIQDEQLIGGAGGDVVVNSALYTFAYEIVSPYSDTDLARLQWVQSGDVLTLTHPSYAPRTLTRVSATDWVFSTVSFARPDGLNGGTFYLKDPLPVADATHPKREWDYYLTAVFRDAKGVLTESKPAKIENLSTALWPPAGVAPYAGQVAIYIDKTVTVWVPAAGVGAIPADHAWIQTRIYRGRGGYYGWIGDLNVGDEEFTDVGQEPVYADQPPRGQNPFEVYDDASVLLRTEEPAAVAYFEERLCFGGTAERPGRLFCSVTGDYYNFDERFVQVKGEALNLELASRKRIDVRSMFGATRLLVFTGSSVWSVRGQQGEPLDFDSINMKMVEEIGAGFVPPLGVDGSVLYARAKGVGVRSLVPANTESDFQGLDISSVAEHLFTGLRKTVVDWCFQEDPWGLVWIVREDGKLLSLTYSLQDQQWAWASHDTDGEVVGICSVPEGDEDAVYLAVNRPDIPTGFGSTVYIERMTSRVNHDSVEDDVCLDSALRYDDAPALVIAGLTHLEGKDVWAVASGTAPQGPYTVENGAITLGELPEANDGGNVVLFVGLPFTPELETLDLAATQVRHAQKNVISVGFEVDNSVGLSLGQDFEHLVEWRQRTVSSSYSPVVPTTEFVVVPVLGTWNRTGRAALRQTLPLPVTVVALTRELDIGG